MDIQNKLYTCIKKNDIENVKLLLKNKKVDVSDEDNLAIELASTSGHFDIVKLLLDDKRVDPTDNRNWTIQSTYEKAYYDILASLNDKKNFNIFSFNNKYVNIIKLLWRDERVKSSLKNDDNELYDKLIKQDISDKIEEF
tara:strand:- start:1311 stop:1730 length:420 start_codon:yes stop_codon:yes gene_type:complete